MPRYVILGSGMAGFGAAHRLRSAGVAPVMYDMNGHHGGHTASFEFPSGFTIDEGPHVSFSKNERVKEILAAAVDDEYEQGVAYVNNYWQGIWIDHPAQCNLYDVPHELKVKIIAEFVSTQHAPEKPVANYEEWLRACFGDTFAETFPMEYTKKYHTTEAANLSTDWIGPRLYRPELEEVLNGALSPDTPNVHYITEFRYPKHGGFVSYLNKFMSQVDLRLNHKLIKLDPRAKTLSFANGRTDDYDYVISSIPLPELIPMIVGAPSDVLDAARKLSCSEIIIVSLGIARPDVHSAHWSYFYDDDICFARISTPHLQSPNNVPKGCSSLQVECYYSDKYRPLDCKPDDCIEPVIRDLMKCGVLRDTDEIVFRHAMYVKYGNVIFDLDRAKALDTIHGYLDDIGVSYCGRYGLWAYIWTDQSFLSGDKAADRVLSGASRPIQTMEVRTRL